MIDFSRQDLPNGIPVIVGTVPDSDVASVVIHIRGGWASDPQGQWGLSRLTGLALNLFDRPDPKSQLAHVDYAHDRHRGVFSFSFPRAWAETVGKWIREAFRSPRVEESHFQHARSDIASLLSPTLDEYQTESREHAAVVLEQVLVRAWPDHPVGRSAAAVERARGLVEEIMTISVEAAQAEARAWMQSGRLMIAVAGATPMTDWARDTFGSLPEAPTPDLETPDPRVGFTDVFQVPPMDKNNRLAGLLLARFVPLDLGPAGPGLMVPLTLLSLKLQMMAGMSGLPAKFTPFVERVADRAMAALLIETPDPDALNTALSLLHSVQIELGDGPSSQDRTVLQDLLPFLYEQQTPPNAVYLVRRELERVAQGGSPKTPTAMRTAIRELDAAVAMSRIVDFLQPEGLIRVGVATKRVFKRVAKMLET